jgi:hypothetical protein
LNKSRTRDAPTPTNISTKSEPDREKNGTWLLLQLLLLIEFPVPGGPTSKAPFEFYHQGLCIFLGFQKLTISCISFAPSSPLTSLWFYLFFHQSFAFDFPMLKICPLPPPPPPDIFLMIKTKHQ